MCPSGLRQPAMNHHGTTGAANMKPKKPFHKDDVVQLPVGHQYRLDWVNWVVLPFVKPVKLSSEYATCTVLSAFVILA